MEKNSTTDNLSAGSPNEAPSSPTLVSERTVEYARLNSRFAMLIAVFTSLLTLASIVASSYIARTRNYVAAVPIGEIWEYPMIHWMNTPNRYEEDAKPLHVAQKYVRGLYEVDPLDFNSATVGSSLSQVMLSNRIAELLAYTVPGTSEYLKVNSALEKSQTTFQMYSGCKCLKRFLISDMMVSQPPLPSLRIELIGRFVIFGQDGRRPLAAEDLGLKSIVLFMANDLPLFSRDDIATDTNISGPKAVNPEGWYVVKSQITTIKQNDLMDIRQIRIDSSMKGAY